MNVNERAVGLGAGAMGRADWRRVQLLELLVFLFLIVPSMVLSALALPRGIAFTVVAWATILRDLSLVGLVIFFLWRNGEPRLAIGWSLRDAWKEIGIGLLLFPALLVGTALVERLFRTAGLTAPSGPPSFLIPRDPAQMALALFLVIVVAVAEETVFRGYLIRRLAGGTGSVPVALVVSSAVFSLGHGYEGTAGVATVGVLGLALGAVYLWRGSLIAPITMHFLQDFFAVVVTAWLAHGR